MKLIFDTEWYDIIQDLPPEKQIEVMQAILSFPNGDSDTNVWKKVIRPKLEQQAQVYKKKCEKFAENRQKRWNRRQTDICQTSEQISDKKSEQRYEKVSQTAYVNEDVYVNENVNIIRDNISENKGNSSRLSTARAKKQKFTPPTLDDVIAYCATRDLGEGVARRIHDYYSAADWHDSTGKPILNWKAKIIAVWDKPENHVKNPADEPFYL